MRKTHFERQLPSFFKSRHGGISGIIFEIVLSVVALTLLIMAIYIFRGNMDIIGNSAGKSNELAKVSEASLIPLDKSVVKGSDVISVIRYYAEDGDVAVNVVIGPGQAVSYGSGSGGFDISGYSAYGYETIGEFRNIVFDASYDYEGSRLAKANYIKK